MTGGLSKFPAETVCWELDFGNSRFDFLKPPGVVLSLGRAWKQAA